MNDDEPNTTAAETWVILRRMTANLDALDPEGHDALHELTRSAGIRGGALRALRHLPLQGALHMKDLVPRLHSDKSYATVAVNELERHGYVIRSVDPADRRSRLVELTPVGRVIAREARALHERPPKALTDLSRGELQLLRDLLRRIDEQKHRSLTSPSVEPVLQTDEELDTASR